MSSHFTLFFILFKNVDCFLPLNCLSYTVPKLPLLCHLIPHNQDRVPMVGRSVRAIPKLKQPMNGENYVRSRYYFFQPMENHSLHGMICRRKYIHI